MIVTTVEVHIKQSHIDDFIEATIENHNHSITEEGNMRFDVLQAQDNPCRFTLYEAYESVEAAANHKETPHYLIWRQKVAPWMANDRIGTVHHVIAPRTRQQW